MNRSEKKLGELAGKLKSKNPALVIDAISMLRNQDPFQGAISLLIQTYDSCDNEAIKNNIRDFLNDLKESSAREEVINEINGDHKQSTVAMLVSSCWQSGLDYSVYIPDFARAFNNGDYATAIECFTVIEEFSEHLTRESKDKIILILDENIPKGPPEKVALTRELISVLG